MQTAALALWAGLLLLCHAVWGWVPILDSANLAFHEGGHPIFGLLSSRLAVYGGTLMQLLVPAACAFEMQRQGKPAARAFCGAMLTPFTEPAQHRGPEAGLLFARRQLHHHRHQ